MAHGWALRTALVGICALAIAPGVVRAQDDRGGPGGDGLVASPSATLEARIQRLEDIEEIRLLRFHYHEYINRRLFDRVGDLYAEDAVVVAGTNRMEGRAAIRQSFVDFGNVTPLVMQFPHNHIVEVRGDTASGISYYEARYARNGAALMIAGRYEETYVRVGGRWLIKSMNLVNTFAVPPHVGWGGPRLNYLEPGTGALPTDTPARQEPPNP